MSNTNLINRRDLIAYFLVAGSGALVQIVCGSILRDYMEYYTALFWAYLVSFIVGFVLTKMFAFNARNSNATRREMVKFVIVSAISLGVTLGMAAITIKVIRSFQSQDLVIKSPFNTKQYFNLSELFGQISGMGFSFVSNYILHKTFTFKSTGFYDRLKAIIK